MGDGQCQLVVGFVIGLLGVFLAGAHHKHDACTFIAFHRHIILAARVDIAVSVAVHIDEHPQRGVLVRILLHGRLGARVRGGKLGRLMVGGIVQHRIAVCFQLLFQRQPYRDDRVALVLRAPLAARLHIFAPIHLPVGLCGVRVVYQYLRPLRTHKKLSRLVLGKLEYLKLYVLGQHIEIKIRL